VLSLVSFSPSKVWQFSFEHCPLVQEINSAIHYLPCFGGGLSAVFVYWDFCTVSFFLCPAPISGEGCVPLTSLHFLFYYSLLFFFSFAEQFSFGCCSVAQKMSSVIYYLPWFEEWLITCPFSIFTLFLCLFTDNLG
jgi:hypothetical protein